MAVYHRTQRLQIYGNKPEVTQLFGGRYSMVVRCIAKHDTEAWYKENKDQIFAGFGTLYSAQMSVDGIDPRSGEAYSNMCLVSNGASYTQTGEYVITFIYETLTDSWTLEKGDVVQSADNGLRLIERSEVAKITAAAPYDEDNVGVSTITNGGKTLYLAGFKDETQSETNTQIGRVTSRWAEAGILNLSTPLVGGQQRVEVSAFNLTSAEVDTLLSEVTGNHELINESVSDRNGIKTSQYTFELNDFEVRSQTENGLQLLTRTELSTTTISDGVVGTDTYLSLTLAGEEIDNGNTIKKRVSRWAEAGILNVSSNKVGGSQQVSVQAFNKSEAQVIADLAAVTNNHKLIDIKESNHKGIKTSTFTFEVDNFDVTSTKENGLLTLARTSLSESSYTDGNIGVSTITVGSTTLYLFGEDIDNGNTIKKRVQRWAEAGILNRGTVDMDDGSLQQRVTSYLAVEPTATGIVTSRNTGSFEGLSTFTVTEILDSTGSALSSTEPNLVKTTSSVSSFSVPGLVSLRENESTEFTEESDGSILGNNFVNFSFDLRGPIDVSCPTQTLEYIQTESEIQSTDYKLGGATGLWSPGSWASSRVTGVDKKNKPFSVSKAYRGYRAPENLIRFETDPVTGSKFASGLERYMTAPRTLSGDSTSMNNVKIFIDGYQMANKIPPVIEIGGGPENPVGRKYVTNITIQPDFKDIDGNVYYRKTVTTKDVKGDSVDDASSGDSTSNLLGSYTSGTVNVTDQLNGGSITAYTLELDASLYSSQPNYYAGGLLEVYARDLDSTNAFKPLQQFIINSYDPDSNKVLLYDNIDGGQAVGRYNSGTLSDINSYDFARIRLTKYALGGKVASSVPTVRGLSVQITNEFLPSRRRGSNFDYTGWQLRVTHGGANFTYPLKLFGAIGLITKNNTFRVELTTDTRARFVAGNTVVLVPPLYYNWPNS